MVSGAPGGLLVGYEGPVATITLHRPEARNALTLALWDELGRAVAELDVDEGVRAAVLTGTDPAFCAGFDLRGLSSEDPEVRDRQVAQQSTHVGMLPPHGIPLIAAVNGPAITGGLELALACDVIIASDRARFGDTHARVGAVPGGGLTILLPRRIGPGRARLMSLTGDYVDAATAGAWGLSDLVVPHHDLLARAQEVAASMAEIPAGPIAEIRRMYDAFADRSDPGAFAEEQAWSKRWMAERFDAGRLAEQRERIVERGRGQG